MAGFSRHDTPQILECAWVLDADGSLTARWTVPAAVQPTPQPPRLAVGLTGAAARVGPRYALAARHISYR